MNSTEHRPADDARPDCLPSAEPMSSESVAASTTPTTGGTPVDGPERTGRPARGTSVMVRRGRKPTLGMWVVLSLVVGALVGVIVALLAHVSDLSTTLYFAATGVFFVGLPIAAVFGIADSIRAGRQEREHRRHPSA